MKLLVKYWKGKGSGSEWIHAGCGRPGERLVGLGHCRGRPSGRFGCAENKEAERWMTRASAGRFKKAQIWELAGHVDNGGDQ